MSVVNVLTFPDIKLIARKELLRLEAYKKQSKKVKGQSAKTIEIQRLEKAGISGKLMQDE